MKIFDRWRVVSISYYNQAEKAAGKELTRHLYRIPFMTYRGACRWKRELEWNDTLEGDRYFSEYLIVRSTDTWR